MQVKTAYVIDWESIAALCPDEWKAFVDSAQPYRAPISNARAGIWLGVVAHALKYEDDAPISILKALTALCTAFYDKTQLDIHLYFQGSLEGYPGDDVPAHDGYFAIMGWECLSSAARALMQTFPATRVANMKWISDDD